MATQGLFTYNDINFTNRRSNHGITFGPNFCKFFSRVPGKKFFSNCEVVPKLYLRCFDDTYAVFDKGCFEFLDILNSGSIMTLNLQSNSPQMPTL